MNDRRSDNIHRLITPNTHMLRGRGIYLLPNLFTTAALFAGFYAMMSSIHHHFQAAAIGILAAIVLDGMDGRIARMTNTQSDFGAEYDSLADMVSFGVAPAVLAYEWMLHDIGKFGFLVAFVYVSAAALRLARFNVQKTVQDKRYFKGLPSPSAAALVATTIWFAHDYQLHGEVLAVVLTLAVTACAALLMVSNIRYYSFKDLDLRGRIPFVVLLAMVLGFGFISVDPPLILMLGFVVYTVSGVLFTLMQLRRSRAERRRDAARDRDVA
ncbi:MAG TPA: CDP-diacylglycerol--serine O-phosphatidyltransferase [Gammaproteobacteria bacterium]|nr:CDP-diacylglycerol--serine O-phosphatidyltransferase [Gammaproteobacteria bacterium]